MSSILTQGSTMNKKSKLVGVSSLLLATLLYSTFGIFSRVVAFNLPIFFQNWSRALLESLVLGLFILFLKKWTKVSLKDFFWIALREIGAIFAFFGPYIAFLYLSFGTTYFVFYAGSTIGGYFLGKVFFKEKIDRQRIVSLFLALIGLCLIYSINISSGKTIYVLISFLGGLGVSIWNIFSKKISHKYSALQLNFLDLFLYFVIMFILSLVLREVWPAPNTSTPFVVNLLYAFIFLPTGQLIIYGFRHLDAHVGSLIMLTEILFGVFIGLFVYKESVSLMTWIGGILIVSSMILPEIKIKKLFN